MRTLVVYNRLQHDTTSDVSCIVIGYQKAAEYQRIREVVPFWWVMNYFIATNVVIWKLCTVCFVFYIAGMCMDYIFQLTLLFWPASTDQVALFFVIPCFNALGDAVWQAQTNGELLYSTQLITDLDEQICHSFKSFNSLISWDQGRIATASATGALYRGPRAPTIFRGPDRRTSNFFSHHKISHFHEFQIKILYWNKSYKYNTCIAGFNKLSQIDHISSIIKRFIWKIIKANLKIALAWSGDPKQNVAPGPQRV